MGRASGVAAVVDALAMPAIDGIMELLETGEGISGDSSRNRDCAQTFTTFADVRQARRSPVCDATTSGGLLIAVSPAAAPSLPSPIVGEIVDGEAGTVAVR